MMGVPRCECRSGFRVQERGWLTIDTTGRFITLEGGEGAGKTTLIASLKQRIAAETGREIVVTREPGGVPIAEAIRGILLDMRSKEMDPRTEALLYAAARRQHLAEVVLPAVARGAIVLCDRFVDSSLAYQGYARGLGMDEVWAINHFAIEDCMPQLTLYLDLDPAVGLERIAANSAREVNRLDVEGLRFHQLVREGYQEAARQNPTRIVTLDAAQTPEQLAEEAWKSIMNRL